MSITYQRISHGRKQSESDVQHPIPNQPATTTPRELGLRGTPSLVRRAKAEARRETLRDKLARKLEEHADEVVAAYRSGIRSDDPNRAYRATDAWISRVHGRPEETVENVTAFDDPLDVASMTREQRDARKRELLRQHPELAQELTDAIRSVAYQPGCRPTWVPAPVPPR